VSEPVCDAVTDLAYSTHEEPVVVRCERPLGHDAPHREHTETGKYTGADCLEWWPEKW